LQRIVEAKDANSRRAAFAILAVATDRAGAAEYLLKRLLRRGPNGQRFAMEVASLLTPPLPVNLLFDLADLVEIPKLITRLRLGVAAQIIRSVPENSPLIEHIIEAFRKKVSPGRAANRLRRLAALVPNDRAVADALAEYVGDSISACPRCGARLGKEDLVRHLWEKHRLLFEQGRVREPWDVIAQWVSEYARTGRAVFLDRSCDLAQALDPSSGLTRVHRLLLLGGTDEDEARALLRAEAEEQNATLCPHCYALVPQPARAIPAPVVIASGRVDGGGFRVDLSNRYMYTRLEVYTPDATLFAGPDPDRALTRRGATLIFLVPLLVVAVVVSVMPPLLGLAPAVPVFALVLAAIAVYLGTRGVWSDAGEPADRATDHAWTLLIPRMLQYELRREDAAFLAGLAHASIHRGDAETREESLARAIDTMRRERVAIPYVTPLSILRITDAIQAGGDDLPPIAAEVGECFDGKLPLDHGARLLKELRGDPVDRTRRARLRVLVLARAYAAGLEADDLRILGQVSPMLGSSFASEDRDGLARLKLLWLYRPRRLWQRVGSATTVFDLARYPKLAENYLQLRPDLLLFQASGGNDEAAPILICEEGVVYRNVVITDPRTPIRVRSRSLVRGGGHELTIDDSVFKFRDDPTLLARRLKGWAEFLFDEFLPRARQLVRRRSQIGDHLLSQKAMSCPECRQVFLGLTGEIGLAAVPPAVEEVE
jgi:uncharacterized C2H2 Zn-finger protein